MASTRKSTTAKGSTRWQAVWSQPAPGGTTQRRTKNFATQREARAYAQKMERDVERRGVGDPNRHSLDRYLEGWLAGLSERNELSPTTLQAYRRNVGLACAHIGHIALEKLSPADLDGRYTLLLQRGGKTHKADADGRRGERPLKAQTVLHVHRVLHSALEQARKWKLIAENPAKDATAPTVGRRPVKAFTEAEVGRLLAAAELDRETTIIVSTLLITGMRRSELLGLALDALDLEQGMGCRPGTLTIKRVVLEVNHAPVIREDTKSESSARTLHIPPPLVELLREQRARVLEAALLWGKGYRREPMFLFARPDGEPLDPLTMTVRLRQVMRRAGIAGRPPTHGWRHTAATLLVASGTDVKTVQTRLGHSTPAITLALYVHPTRERDEAAGAQLASLLTGRKKP